MQQIFEGFELLGFETRNKYRVSDEAGRSIGFAAEERKGIFDFFFRQILGHWRKFTIRFFSQDRSEYLVAHHPFRFFFQRLEVSEPSGELIGSIQQRFSILYKLFELEDSNGKILAEMKSPIWRIWTFPIKRNGLERGLISKKWGGLLSEAFTDKDKFRVSFTDSGLSIEERKLMLAASIFIDLQYFEKKS